MLEKILSKVHDTTVINRDQTEEESYNAENPHIAPDWNSFRVQETIIGMIFIEAALNKDKYPEGEHYPGLFPEESEEAVPGFTKKVAETVKAHTISDRLRLDLYLESRDIACKIIREMPEQSLKALMDAASKNVDQHISDEYRFRRRAENQE